jgi:iron-sulfur cluster assembly protein
MAISMTPKAIERARVLIAERDDAATWLRLGIRGGGCSGLSYFLDFVPTPEEKDKEFDFEGLPVCVDRKSYLYLNGTEVDYEESLIRAGFVFTNPLAKRTCSCGESFTL